MRCMLKTTARNHKSVRMVCIKVLDDAGAAEALQGTPGSGTA